MMKLCLPCQTLSDRHSVPVRHLFPVESHLQDVVAVVLRESALLAATGGTLTFDVDVRSEQTHRKSTAWN